MTDWRPLLAERMAEDPEFAAYIEGLAPGTPLQAAVRDYGKLLILRGGTLHRQGLAEIAVADVMREHGIEHTDDLLDAWQRGEVTLTDAMVEALIETGAWAPDA